MLHLQVEWRPKFAACFGEMLVANDYPEVGREGAEKQLPSSVTRRRRGVSTQMDEGGGGSGQLRGRERAVIITKLTYNASYILSRGENKARQS